ncbi:hypothetical protein J5I95_16085 [Candidatus Poribacteria bacterium]|nr:hypothetical protein [Candidatus Poribacteria bacterium]
MPILTLEIDVIQRECLPNWQTFEKENSLTLGVESINRRKSCCPYRGVDTETHAYHNREDNRNQYG